MDRGRVADASVADRSAHLVDELLGIDNVPMAVWIDEDGRLPPR